MLQDNEPPSNHSQGKTSKVLLWSLVRYGCLGFGGVVLIGLLAAIVLPVFVSQASKAHQSEAQLYIGSLNRAQQAYFLEQNTFSDDLETLSPGISAGTESYTFQVEVQQTQPPMAITIGTPVQDNLKGYVGLVFVTPIDSNSSTTRTILCKTDAQVTATTPMPSPLPTVPMTCPNGFVAVKRGY